MSLITNPIVFQPHYIHFKSLSHHNKTAIVLKKEKIRLGTTTINNLKQKKKNCQSNRHSSGPKAGNKVCRDFLRSWRK